MLNLEMKNSGGSYTSRESKYKHVVVCVTHLERDFINHFLKEFYGHRQHQVKYKITIILQIDCIIIFF